MKVGHGPWVGVGGIMKYPPQIQNKGRSSDFVFFKEGYGERFWVKFSFLQMHSKVYISKR